MYIEKGFACCNNFPMLFIHTASVHMLAPDYCFKADMEKEPVTLTTAMFS